MRLDAVREHGAGRWTKRTSRCCASDWLWKRIPASKKKSSTDLALAALDGTDTQARLDAINTLSGSLSQDVRNKLAALIAKNPDGSFTEKDDAVRKAASAAVASHRPMAHLLFGY